ASRPEFLIRCGLTSARALVVTMDSPEGAEAVVAEARRLRPDLIIVARARDARHARSLYELGATDALPETIEASLQLSEALLVDRGVIPIFEPGLDVLVAKNVEEGRLTFTVDANEAIRGADAVFIAVGTPTRRGDGHADLSYVYAAAEEIAGLIDGFTVIVTKSTVPVGTGDEVEAIIRKARPDAQFAVVSNPEFLREGAAINDFKRPDRVVVGTEDERAKDVMR